MLKNPLIPDYIPESWHSRVRVLITPDGQMHFLWVGWHNGQGHGKISIAGKMRYTHREIYQRVHGVILKRFDYIDHVAAVCGLKPCMTVEHLEKVPPSVNTSRGPGRHTQFKALS